MKLGIYCRTSKTKDGNDLSIPDQKQKGIKKAKELSLPYELYIDEGKSGGSDNIDERPAFQRLIADIVNGSLSAIYAFDQSRIERNPQVRFIINDIFKKYNISYYTELDGLVDLKNPQSEFYGDLMSVINKYHITLTKLKVKSALKTRVASGKTHSILPYGYRKDFNGELTIDEEESETIRKIFEMSLSGVGTRSIAAFLNETCIQTRYNKKINGSIRTKNKYTGEITITNNKDIKWEGNTVRNIIKNTIYKGEKVYSGDIYQVPAIISQAMWDKVNANLPNNRNNSGKKVDHQYLLKGLIRCGVCGKNMYGRRRISKHDNAYICSSRRIKNETCGNRGINIDKLEALIWDRFFKSDEFLNRLRNEFKPDDTKTNELKKQIEHLKKKISSLNAEKKRAVELVVKGTLSENDVKDLLIKTNKSIIDSESQIKEKTNMLSAIENSIQTIKKYEDEFIEFTSKTTFLQKRKVLHDFVKNIIVEYDNSSDCYDISIEFKIDLTKEHYQAYNNFTHILHGENFIVPRTLRENKFRLPKVITIEGGVGEILGGDDSPPFRVYSDGIERVYNTKVPYGDIDDWSEDEIEYFYKNNPNWYCKESGISLWSKNEELPSYKVAKSKYQKELAKKNDLTLPSDTISSEIVW